MKPNLSLFERTLRLLLGLVLATVALSQPDIGVAETLVLIAASCLVLNGLLARCYLWKWLGINTACNEIRLPGITSTSISRKENTQ